MQHSLRANFFGQLLLRGFQNSNKRMHIPTRMVSCELLRERKADISMEKDLLHLRKGLWVTDSVSNELFIGFLGTKFLCI